MAIYEKHTFRVPSLPFIFCKNCARYKNQYDSGNWHENIEILYFTSGSGMIRIDGKNYTTSPGDVFVVNANKLHEFFSDSEMHYTFLIVDREFFTENYVDIDNVYFSEHFRDEAIKDTFNELAALYESDLSCPWRELSIRSQVLKIITLLCKEHSEPFNDWLDKDASILLAVKRAIGHIRTEYTREILLDEISSIVGISKYHFAREFHRITGYTIVNYINLTRCEYAKALLRENEKSILEIAECCGFSDQSYFSRIFKRTIGLSPTKYRKCSQTKK